MAQTLAADGRYFPDMDLMIKVQFIKSELNSTDASFDLLIHSKPMSRLIIYFCLLTQETALSYTAHIHCP